MNGYDVHGTIYLNCTIYDPWAMGSDPLVGQTWLNSELKALLSC